MGLAASQARLLSITQRMSDNELRAQLINNQKMRLSSESSQVSENYINALNKTNLVFANYDENDKAQNVPLTFNSLTAFNQYNNQYGLTNTAGNILISEQEAELYQQSNGELDEYLKLHGIEYTTSYWDTITDQLQDVEAFYSNPDGDGVAEKDGEAAATKDNAGNAIGNNTTDGIYNFYNATELREMYEGVPMTSPTKYEETLKTKEYTDFSGYVDSFAQQAAALKQAAAQKNQLLGSYTQAALSTGATFRAIDSLTTFPPNAAELATINTSLGNDISRYYDGATFNAATDGISADILTDFEHSGSTYLIHSSVQDHFDNAINKPTKLYSDGYDAAALYLRITNNTTTPASYDYYARVEDPSGNDDIVFAKINNSGRSNLYQWNSSSSSMEQYEYNDTEDNGQTTHVIPTTIVTRNGNKVQFTYEELDDQNNVVDTITYQYPEFDSSKFTTPPSDNTTTNAKISSVIDESEFKTKVKDILKAEAAQIFKSIGAGTSGARLKESTFVNSYTFTDDNGQTQTKTFTDDEKEILLSQTATNANVDEILQNICTLLFGEANRNKITNSDDMTEFLDTIMSGKLKGFMEDGASITLRNTGTTIQKSDLADNKIINCFEAYILDTLMDIFGEPVYGYLYTDGNGKVKENISNIDASAEAQWLTNLFEKINSCGYQMLPKGLASSTEWIQFALENGIVIMEQVNSNNNWQPITYNSCSDISEQTDSSAATIAEAEYNKAMRQIEAKDEMYDLELKNIDTEHSSLESEYESVKKAMSSNIERTFQMYS